MINEVQTTVSGSGSAAVPLSPSSPYRGVLVVIPPFSPVYSDLYIGGKVRTVRTLDQHSVFDRPTVHPSVPCAIPTKGQIGQFMTAYPAKKVICLP